MKTRSSFFFYGISFAVQTVLSFTLIHFTTKRLEPADFGLMAMLFAHIGLGSAFSSFGPSQVIMSHFYLAKTDTEKSEIISSGLYMAVLKGCLMWAVLVGAWMIERSFWDDLRQLSVVVVAVFFTNILCSVPLLVLQDVLVTEGRAAAHALVNISTQLVNFAVTLIFLMHLNLGIHSLMAGAFLSAVAGSLILLWIFRRYVGLKISRAFAQDSLLISMYQGGAQIAEQSRAFVERFFLGNFISISDLGGYSHASQYSNSLMSLAKVAGRAIWPLSLSEAVGEKKGFPKTMLVWNFVGLGFFAVACVFSSIGGELLRLLTNGKFVFVWPVVVALMAILPLRCLGRPATAILYAEKKTVKYSRSILFGSFVGLVSVMILAPWLGILGLVVAAVLEQIFIRGILIKQIDRSRKMGSETLLYVVSCLIGVQATAVYFFRDSQWRNVVVSLTVVVLLFGQWKVLRDLGRNAGALLRQFQGGKV